MTEDIEDVVGPVLDITADYHCSPFGVWTATLTVHPPAGLPGAEPFTTEPSPGVGSAAECMEQVLAQVDVYAEHFTCLTLGTLDGDAEAWALLAQREGLAP